MNLIQNYLNAFRYMFDYRSKASRAEFVSFWIVNIFTQLPYNFAIIIAPNYFKDITLINSIYGYIICIPFLSLSLRRLNDVGANRLYYVVPIYGLILCFKAANTERSKKDIDLKHFISLFALTFATYIMGFVLLLLNIFLYLPNVPLLYLVFDYRWGFISYLAIAGLTLPASFFFDGKGNQPIKYHLLIHLIACILIFLFTWLCALL